ncbi:MAG: hypothetical protein KAJ63_10090 [Methyloprofundus sp.]|nr:hypothetical protein [Methyloprofundus sp.]
MINEKETQSESEVASNQPHTLQVGIRMQQGEHTGQPIYSNFTAVQGGQGVVLVDFGFVDPKAMQALAQMTQSGEKAPDTISARMSSRVAISVDAAANLQRQLSQLLRPQTSTVVNAEVEGSGDMTMQ